MSDLARAILAGLTCGIVWAWVWHVRAGSAKERGGWWH